MSFIANLAHKILAHPVAFKGFYRLIGAARGRRLFAANDIRARPGDRVLDLGCGPADILRELPEVDYQGVDLSPGYIESARRRYGERGTFTCQGVEDFLARGGGEPFDIILAIGLFHHLDDGQAETLVRGAARRLVPGGRFVSIDPCYADGQGRIERYLLDSDRGDFVRRAEGYRSLAALAFASVEVTINSKALRLLPYSNCTLQCRARAAGA